MKKLIVVGIIILLVGMGVPSTGINVERTSTALFDGNILYVGGNGPGNYTKIQDAIDDADDGDTVFVYDDSSPYYENIIVNKSINLLGENRNTTIIDGKNSNDVICLKKHNYGIKITGFTIQNSGSSFWDDAGLEICSKYCDISNNIFSNNSCGVYVVEKGDLVEGNFISNNIVRNNTNFGIRFEDSFSNYISENIIADNYYGIYIEPESLPCTEEKSYLPTGFFEDEIYSNKIINNEIGLLISHEWAISIYKNNISNNKRGIHIFGSHDWGGNIEIFQNNIMNNNKGITIECFLGGANNNNICENNFIKNKRNAYFNSKNNNWDGNYWSIPRFLPKPVIGGHWVYTPFIGFTITWFNFDWHPAKEPYDIGV